MKYFFNIAFFLFFISLFSTAKLCADPGSGTSDYTYRKDCRFQHMAQLRDRVFIPASMAKGTEAESNISPNQVRIHIHETVVDFKGIAELTSLEISSSAASKTGFDFKLVDPETTEEAKLKIITDESNFVQLIYFYSDKWGKYTFSLPTKSESQLVEEYHFFTSQEKINITSAENLHELTIAPYQMRRDGSGASAAVAVKEKIAYSRKFQLRFVDNELILSDNGLNSRYEISDIAFSKPSKTDRAAAEQVLRIKVKGDDLGKLEFYLAEDGSISYFQLDDTIYYLM